MSTTSSWSMLRYPKTSHCGTETWRRRICSTSCTVTGWFLFSCTGVRGHRVTHRGRGHTQGQRSHTGAEVTGTGPGVTETGSEVTETGTEVTGTGPGVTETGSEVTETGSEVTDGSYMSSLFHSVCVCAVGRLFGVIASPSGQHL
ncbi:hypothetical protein EYF80_067695 [Liparis tanakae]|uniref:Uncharacterized protein n=1 Tax=Liparis tanakae TaxID=230148 RepID=A0A4Z2E073_9TELE|nr:hypothetical protein EYF80_067695 [Liparis tanakae]